MLILLMTPETLNNIFSYIMEEKYMSNKGLIYLPTGRKSGGKPTKPKLKFNLTPTARKKIREEAIGKCEKCNTKIKSKLQVHHIREVEDGGKHIQSNLIVLCRKCHTTIHSLSPALSKTQMKNLVKKRSKRKQKDIRDILKKSRVKQRKILKRELDKGKITTNQYEEYINEWLRIFGVRK